VKAGITGTPDGGRWRSWDRRNGPAYSSGSTCSADYVSLARTERKLIYSNRPQNARSLAVPLSHRIDCLPSFHPSNICVTPHFAKLVSTSNARHSHAYELLHCSSPRGPLVRWGRYDPRERSLRKVRLAEFQSVILDRRKYCEREMARTQKNCGGMM